MAATRSHRSDALNQLLNALLGDEAVSTSPPAPATAVHSGHTSIGSTQLPFQHNLQSAGGPEQGQQGTEQERGNSNDRRGNRGLRLRLKQLEQSLHEQQQELRQQVHHNLYLTQRVALVEQIIELHDQHAACLAEVRSGLTHNPFASWHFTVEEASNIKPEQWAQKYNQAVRSVAERLACINPLLQAYPQLAHHRPPIDQLQQLARELSLAEPTNPYGADGLPVGSLTVPVPAKVLHSFAAMYGIDISSMCAAECSMLESCVVLVVEQLGLSKGLLYGLMLAGVHGPYYSPAVNVSEVAAYPSWESLSSCVASLAANQDPHQVNAAAHVADEAMWHEVVKHVDLTDTQKLEATIVQDIFHSARAAIRKQRARLAHELLGLSNLAVPASAHVEKGPAGVPREVGMPESNQMAAPFDPLSDAARLSQSSAAQQQSVRLSGTRTHNDSNSATAVYRLTPEQLTQREVLMRRLEDTTAQERSLMTLLGMVLRSVLLSPVQLSQVVVHCYPYKCCRWDFIAACAAACTPTVMDSLAASVTPHKQGN